MSVFDKENAKAREQRRRARRYPDMLRALREIRDGPCLEALDDHGFCFCPACGATSAVTAATKDGR